MERAATDAVDFGGNIYASQVSHIGCGKRLPTLRDASLVSVR